MTEKEKQHIYNKRWYEKHSLAWRVANREKLRKWANKWRKENIEKARSFSQKYYKKNAKTINENQRNYTKRLRIKVLTYYSNGEPKCKCCNENLYEFLSIDHINGNGSKWRKALNMKTGRDTYMWLVKNNYPKGFRVLCHNCNFASGHYKICPHKKL